MKKTLLFSLALTMFSTIMVNAQTIGVYTENTEIVPSASVITVGQYQLTAEEVTDAENVYEGSASTFISNSTFTAGKIYWTVPTGEFIDLTSYIETGYLNFAIKTTSVVPFVVEFKSGGANARMIFDETSDLVYGLARDGKWHFINIPLKDYAALETLPATWNWATVNEPFTLRMHVDPAGQDFSMYVDHIFISMSLPAKPTSIYANSKSELLSFPNPVENMLNFSSNDWSSGEIYNITGQKVLSFSNNSRSLDVSGLSKGVYILSLNSGDKVYRQKFSKR
jgi:hypothetical protein